MKAAFIVLFVLIGAALPASAETEVGTVVAQFESDVAIKLSGSYQAGTDDVYKISRDGQFLGLAHYRSRGPGEGTITAREEEPFTTKPGDKVGLSYRMPAPPPQQTRPLPPSIYGPNMTVKTWSQVVSPGKGFIYVQGILRNDGTTLAKSVKVKVTCTDSNGSVVSIDDGYADPHDCDICQEVTFKIMVKNEPNIADFHLNVHWDH